MLARTKHRHLLELRTEARTRSMRFPNGSNLTPNNGNCSLITAQGALGNNSRNSMNNNYNSFVHVLLICSPLFLPFSHCFGCHKDKYSCQIFVLTKFRWRIPKCRKLANNGVDRHNEQFKHTQVIVCWLYGNWVCAHFCGWLYGSL